ncbi:MAG: DUF5017 domain-containing protein [Bacteroidales bacterium]|nr:DUF5017 domain-containing protein [Bacteroidales bacterium]
MKKIFFPLISGFAFAVLLGGCKDFNDQFTGLDDKAKPTNLVKYTYQLVDADYSTISKAALAAATNAADSALAKSIATNKYFSTSVPGTIYVPFLLKTKYPFGDVGSSAIITSTFGQDKPTYMTDLTTINIISDADYKSVWGDPILYVNAFTPAKSPSSKIPGLLTSKFPTATSGTYKFVEYNYSSTEAASGVVDYKYFYDDFETHTCATSSPYTAIGENGWQQKDTSGTKGIWYCRTFSSNKYAQVTSNATNELNNSFLLTKQIDLTYAIAPQFTFNVNVGYWNADCLTVLVSENFDGNKDNIKNATWVDLTSDFAFPQIPTSGYGVLASAGTSDLSSYIGKKIYIAFKYSGDSRTATSPKITTTYQIDNVKVSEMRTALSVPSSEKQYVVYKYNGTTWITPLVADGIFVSLQPADYTAMGLSYISSTNVPLYLPQYLKQKFPYALEGDVKTLVYKSSSTITYSGATQYTMTSGVWTSNTFKINKAEQFIFTVDGWVFDPTVTLDMVASDYLLMVNYVKNTPAISKFYDVKYANAEYYYGFASNYSNVSFRLSYRNPFFTDPYTQPASLDPELSALTTNADKVALLWTRLQEGMGIFLQLRYPNAIPQISGLDVYYNVRVKVYTPDGVTSSVTDTYNYKFKCTASGTPPTFEFVSKAKM